MPRPGRFYRSARWLACLNPLDVAAQWVDEAGRVVGPVVGWGLWAVLAPARMAAWLAWHVLKPVRLIPPEYMEMWEQVSMERLDRETDPRTIALRCLALWQLTGEREWIAKADDAYPRWRWTWHRRAPARFGWAVVRLLRRVFRRPALVRRAGHGRLPRRRV